MQTQQVYPGISHCPESKLRTTLSGTVTTCVSKRFPPTLQNQGKLGNVRTGSMGILGRPSVKYASGSATARFPVTHGTKLTMMLLQVILDVRLLENVNLAKYPKIGSWRR